ncbi:psoriasis susceptibility 1 candidate gene 2 protein [Morphnus guianensis]
MGSLCHVPPLDLPGQPVHAGSPPPPRGGPGVWVAPPPLWVPIKTGGAPPSAPSTALEPASIATSMAERQPTAPPAKPPPEPQSPPRPDDPNPPRPAIPVAPWPPLPEWDGDGDRDGDKPPPGHEETSGTRDSR